MQDLKLEVENKQQLNAPEKFLLFSMRDFLAESVSRLQLKRLTGMNAALFEHTLQNLMRRDLVEICPRRGLKLTRKGMLYVFGTRQ